MGRGHSSYSAEQKLAILKEHLVGKTPVADVCEKHGIQPSVYYGWQKALFESDAVFERKKSGHNENLQLKKAKSQLEALEKTVREKDAVLAELMCEHLRLKKNMNGGS